MTALELQVGDVLQLGTGAVVVLRRDDTHGGVELLVRPRAGRGGKGTGASPRTLWLWPRQAVTASCGTASSNASRSPGRVGRAEAARNVARARRAAPGGAGAPATDRDR